MKALSWKICKKICQLFHLVDISWHLMIAFVFFSLCSATEDVELWFAEVENLLAVEDLGKVKLNAPSIMIEITILLNIFLSKTPGKWLKLLLS